MSFGTVAENAAFAQKFDFPFLLLCDTDRALGLAYGACDDAKAGYAKRMSYLINEAGEIQRVYGSVNAGSHPAEVLADLVS